MALFDGSGKRKHIQPREVVAAAENHRKYPETGERPLFPRERLEAPAAGGHVVAVDAVERNFPHRVASRHARERDVFERQIAQMKPVDVRSIGQAIVRSERVPSGFE